MIGPSRRVSAAFRRAASVSISLLILLFALSACNTVQGVGRDIEDVGGTIEDSAD